MSIELQKCSEWDPGFFSEFVGLSLELYKDHPYYLRESIKDFEAKFSRLAPFNQNNDWLAILAKKNQRVMGRILVNCRRDGCRNYAPIGFFECCDNQEIAEKLFSEAESWAKEHGCKEARTPVSGHFFFSYRIQVGDPGREPFHNEPIFPDYYHHLFRHCGYSQSGTWNTLMIPLDQHLKKSGQFLEKLASFAPESVGLTIRGPRFDAWEEEMKLFHKMISASFSVMSDYMPISWEEFWVEYKDIKYIIDPRYTCFVEYKGEPVGFCVAYRDPLKIMLQAQNSPWPWRKLWALWKLKRNKSRLLNPYVGKVLARDDVKGVAAALSKSLLIDFAKEQSYFLSVYNKEDSMSRGALPMENAKVSGTYILYTKKL